MHGGDIYNNKVNIDFSVNINPLGVHPEVSRAIENAVKLCINYPDYTCDSLYEKLADSLAVDRDMICVGNGASELLAWVINYINPLKVFMLSPSFTGYRRIINSIPNCDIITYKLKEENNFLVSLDVVSEIPDDCNLIIITNPNNPNGSICPKNVLDAITKRASEIGAYLLIDECFLEFTDEERYSADYNGLITVGAFTKMYAIPGVRLGYMVCRDKELAEKIRNLLPEWNISVFAQEAGEAALMIKDDYVERTKKIVAEERNYLTEELGKRGLKVFPSDANFLLFKRRNLVDWYGELLKRGILVRSCRDYEGLSDDYLRIAVSTHDKNEILIKTIDQVLSDLEIVR